MNTAPLLLIPLTPDSLCPSINGCPSKDFSACTREESRACGLLPKKEDISRIEVLLARSHYWILPIAKRVLFIKSTFGVNVDESEVDSRAYIAHIISARIILSRR